MNGKRFFLCVVLMGLCFCIFPVLATPPPGGEGYVTFNCNVEGATVSLDGIPVGIISGGSLDVPDGNLYSTYTVTKDGYYDKSGSISFVPGGPANIEISVTLSPKPIGSGKGWFTVHSNIDGASVAFDGVTKGTITSGIFTLEVSTTGTPYTSYAVSRSGYVPYEGSISHMPASDQTIDLYATLNPVPTSPPTTIPTTMLTPIGGDAGWYTVSCNVNGATVYFDSEYKGMIADGTLSVQIYSTGTPFKTYRVEKAGYTTVSGSLPAVPAKGQTVPVRVTLSLISTLTTTVQTSAPVNPPGSEHGWIAIHANVDGATVMVGSNTMGVIRNGELKISAATTGTPYSSFTVAKPGYTTTTGTVPRQPAAGETVDIYVTLSPVQPTTVPTTQSPLPLPVIITSLVGAVLLLSPRRK